jgi:hypothetical protein
MTQILMREDGPSSHEFHIGLCPTFDRLHILLLALVKDSQRHAFRHRVHFRVNRSCDCTRRVKPVYARVNEVETRGAHRY